MYHYSSAINNTDDTQRHLSQEYSDTSYHELQPVPLSPNSHSTNDINYIMFGKLRFPLVSSTI